MTSRAGLVAAFVVASLLGLVLLLAGLPGWALVAVAAAAIVAGGLALQLIVSERRRHEQVEGELAGQAEFLESLVESMGRIAAALEPEEVLRETAREAERLFGAHASLDGGDGTVVPVRAHGRELASLRFDRKLAHADVVRATILADFAARAHESARLLAEAQVRESDRARLSEQLLTAEQDERRRLADHLHDTSVQELSGVALMLDAATHLLEDERPKDAGEILERALERQRSTIGGLRDLSFNLEPVVLRDQGFAPAVDALASQLALDREVQIETAVEAGEALAEKAQAGLYQFIREALTQSVMRGPPRHAQVLVTASDGAVVAVVTDDGPREKRVRNFDLLAERARALNGVFEVEQGDEGGTTVRVRLPEYAAR
jgi:signal transduction histidine kinase